MGRDRRGRDGRFRTGRGARRAKRDGTAGGGKGLRAWFAHAFALDDPGAVLKPEEIHLLDRVARWIVGRRLAAPLSLFLETYRPLGYLGSQALVLAEPFVDMLLGTFPGLAGRLSPEDYRRLTAILERRDALRIFLDRIEAAEKALRKVIHDRDGRDLEQGALRAASP